jgi:hypothetical protein
VAFAGVPVKAGGLFGVTQQKQAVLLIVTESIVQPVSALLVSDAQRHFSWTFVPAADCGSVTNV